MKQYAVVVQSDSELMLVGLYRTKHHAKNAVVARAIGEVQSHNEGHLLQDDKTWYHVLAGEADVK